MNRRKLLHRGVITASLLAAAGLPALSAVAQEKQRSPFDGDPRLDRPVTVHWKKATLFDGLSELSRQTGVALAPDRAVVDEPMMASATRIPARLLLERIGREFHFTWVRSGGNPEAPGYLLYQDRAARQEEEDQIQSARRVVLQAIEAEIQKYRRLRQLSPEESNRELERVNQELEQAVERDPAAAARSPMVMRRMLDSQALYTVTSSIGRAMLDLLNGISQAQWEGLPDGEPLVFSTQPGRDEHPLPASVARQLRRAEPKYLVPGATVKALAPEAREGIRQAEAQMRELWGRSGGFKVTVELELTTGSQPMGMLRVTPEPLGVGEEGAMFEATGLNVMAAPFLRPEQLEGREEREKRLAEDPVLGKKAVLKLPPLPPRRGALAELIGNGYRAAEILAQIEEAFGIALLSDAYNREALSLVPALGERPIPLFRVLDAIAGVDRDWERDGAVIRFRSRTWAHDRRAEVPVRYMRRWLEARGRKGRFTLDDLAEMAVLLRDEQVDSLMFSALEAGADDFTDFSMVAEHRDLLRFYGRLLPGQRRALFQGRKLVVRELYPFQQRLLLTPNRGHSVHGAPLGSRARRSPQDIAGGVISLTDLGPAGEEWGEEVPPGAPGSSNSIAIKIEISYAGSEPDTYVIPISGVSTRQSNTPEVVR